MKPGLLPLRLLLLEDAMSCQKLRDHEVRDVFVSPVRKMTRNTGEKGDIESLSYGQRPALTC
jgi:hypothetical protein